MLGRFLIILILAGIWTGRAQALESLQPGFDGDRGGSSGWSISEAKRAVGDLLSPDARARLVVTEAVRDGGVILVRTQTPDGVPVKTYKVNPRSGEVKG